MSTTIAHDDIESADLSLRAAVSDYLTLMKPRVMTLVILTALTGLIAAPGTIHPFIGLIAIFAISSRPQNRQRKLQRGSIDGICPRDEPLPIIHRRRSIEHP